MSLPLPPRLYADLAYLWPILSPPEHYEAEAQTLRRLIDAHFGGGPAAGARRSILELGAGGGHTLCHLAEDFDCVATDLAEPMLANCRALIPGIDARVGDMRTMRLGRTFDVVLVHDAIDYMTTAEDAQAALDTVAAHLSPGGVAFIAPTYTRETFVDGEVADDGTTTDAAELTYFTFVHDPDPADDQIEMILLYLIRPHPRNQGEGDSSRQVEVVEDRHVCGLFSNADWLAMIGRAGLAGELAEQACGAWSLFVATQEGR